jgi:hypothetical protein
MLAGERFPRQAASSNNSPWSPDDSVPSSNDLEESFTSAVRSCNDSHLSWIDSVLSWIDSVAPPHESGVVGEGGISANFGGLLPRAVVGAVHRMPSGTLCGRPQRCAILHTVQPRASGASGMESRVEPAWGLPPPGQPRRVPAASCGLPLRKPDSYWLIRRYKASTPRPCPPARLCNELGYHSR